MFDETLGAKAGDRTSVAEMNLHLLTLRDAARILLEILGFAAAAILAVGWLTFFGWLMVSNAHRQTIRDLGSQWDCTGLGRGGAHCVKRLTSNDTPNGDSGMKEGCPSLGRAGRICAGRPMHEDHSN
ncbi:hypothetical protein [Methylocapsa sp. S129]|uniref:hypothetical protein n=1 Tax=Methylocapsa sp. S129 TaxID=1641869 RepID=UPI00131C7E12|nr:hypothetical protein [Methylocapsa sp. S129]